MLKTESNRITIRLGNTLGYYHFTLSKGDKGKNVDRVEGGRVFTGRQEIAIKIKFTFLDLAMVLEIVDFLTEL